MTQKVLPKGSPQFCYIAPIEALEYTTDQSDRHLVLAHLIAEINNPDPVIRAKAQRYVDFYKARSDAGDYIICDNSAFELGESFDTVQLIDLAHTIGADALVLPDYPGQHHSVTMKAADFWIPRFKDEGLHTFFVPQSEVGDLSGWMEAYQYATANTDIDIVGWSILGIPNALPLIDRVYARVVMAQLLIQNGMFSNRPYNHFLGLNSGPKLELPSLLGLGVLDSCDSSGPIWSAINGATYTEASDSLMCVNKQQLPHVDFFIDEAKVKDTASRIRSNIELTSRIFK